MWQTEHQEQLTLQTMNIKAVALRVINRLQVRGEGRDLEYQSLDSAVPRSSECLHSHINRETLNKPSRLQDEEEKARLTCRSTRGNHADVSGSARVSVALVDFSLDHVFMLLD